MTSKYLQKEATFKLLLRQILNEPERGDGTNSRNNRNSWLQLDYEQEEPEIGSKTEGSV